MISRHPFKLSRQGVTHVLEKPQLFLSSLEASETPDQREQNVVKPIKPRQEDALGRTKKKSKYQRG